MPCHFPQTGHSIPSFWVFSFNDSLAYISVLIRKIFTFFFRSYFSFFSWYCETTSLEHKRSLRIVFLPRWKILDLISLVRLYWSFSCWRPFFSICLATHLATLAATNYNVWIIRRFQLSLPVTFWYQNKKLLNFLKPAASPKFSCCHSFISFLYDPSSRWESPYLFSNSILAIWYLSLGGWGIQFITSSLASLLVYVISLMSHPRGSSILFSTTSINITIKCR